MRSHVDSERTVEALKQERQRAHLLVSSEKHVINGWVQGLGFTRKRSVDFIIENVVGEGICTGCAACVTICPYDVYDYGTDGNRTRPVATRDHNCTDCKLCVEACPEIPLSESKIQANLMRNEDLKDDGFGLYTESVLARSTDPRVLSMAQDGGVVSTLLVHALDQGLIDGAIVSGVSSEEPHQPIQKLARTREEILNSGGTRYVYSPNVLALREAMDMDLKSVAVVGVPCQIDAVRYLQNGLSYREFRDWYSKSVKITIGLFCSEAFTYEGMKGISEELHIDLKQIKNVNIKGKVIITMNDGRIIESSLKKFRKYVRPACMPCGDYSAEYADMSVGGLGLSGWTFTVLRTKVGKEFFESAMSRNLLEVRPASEAELTRDLLVKLSGEKKERAESTRAALGQLLSITT